jgi:hypothetical protein
MFQFLQVKQQPNKVAPDPGSVSLRQLLGDATLPMSIQALVELPAESRKRLYRVLIPPTLLTRFNINPLTWSDRQGSPCVHVVEKSSPGLLNISCRLAPGGDERDPIRAWSKWPISHQRHRPETCCSSTTHWPSAGTDYDGDGQPDDVRHAAPQPAG